MINAFLKRRLWLWKNKLVPSIFLFFFMPVVLFLMVSVPLKNIIQYSISGIAYDIWVFPGLIFIVGSIALYPIIYREFFDLRVHKKVLINIALAPYSKSQLVYGSLVVGIIEAIIMTLFAGFLYTYIVSIHMNLLHIAFLLLCLIIYLFLMGNIYILLSISIDAITTMILTSFLLFIFIIFGNAFLIELPFFPPMIETLLKFNPVSYPFRCYQIFISTGAIDWFSFTIQIFIIYILFLLNGFLLKTKLRQ
ncbi:MAG: hypothetical protein CMG55_03735 [Candidatus Marinimicrobia bacterium]|nr:hypothetical protein [Candidatus Neomarinimicrobiota bacterium]|tara:strand:+ start:3811 stop:4560 length:750 start_codon:yes stop_codon:yes gene_type:complete